MPNSIYALIDPRTKLIRYVGKARDPIGRLGRHHSASRNGTTIPVCRWIAELVSLGLKPTLHVIEICEGDGCAEEIFHIRLARQDGLQLLNATDGGKGIRGHRHTDETKRKISAAHMGKAITPETRALMSAAHMGRKPSPETIKKTADALRGRKQSPEVVEARRQRLLGRKRSPESVAKMLVTIRSKSQTERQAIAVKRNAGAFVMEWTTEDGRRLRDRRLSLGIGLKDFAGLVGVSRKTVHEIEKAHDHPRRRTLAIIETTMANLELDPDALARHHHDVRERHRERGARRWATRRLNESSSAEIQSSS